ncbi:sigma-70 family RNA polymerase sigma factor [Nocardia jejuensis]|uniref:sigma-70 family RNA polymerase sigma factor n=1 Tax=Nocardia jejuensis TaxID=328049 RepID=UPI000831A298|nr:sigma-70 family RNA polymerase sigma factor [Nocardia jejuensis]
MTSRPREAPDPNEFIADTERFRRELLAHCYRMMGSAHDAEDLVQETYLRAWRSYAGFEGRASVRSWLYRIATNVCFTALQSRRVRVLPSGLGGPYDGPSRAPTPAAPGEISWLEPVPDAWIAPATDDPVTVVLARESVRLALIASLQHLPSRQRAILLLREVLAFPAADTAEILGITIAAVKSGLQRARARLNELHPVDDGLLEPTDHRARALLDAYIAAFENSDAALLEQVLRVDALLEATPFRDWQAGRARCLQLLAAYVLGAPGTWRMIATTANGQPAAAVYHRGSDGVLRASGIVVLGVTATGVSRVVEFQDSTLVATFGLPDTLAA